MQTWFLYVSLILLGFLARETVFGKRVYTLYTCPLSPESKTALKPMSSDGDSRGGDSGGNRHDNSVLYIRYSTSHAYVQIGSTCYDWGNWNYPRRIDCGDEEFSWCVKNRRSISMGTTFCANRICEFESAWINQGRDFNLFFWNCQAYADKMIEFLQSCDATSLFGEKKFVRANGKKSL